MQLAIQIVDFCTNAIALFGAAYFLVALTAHLHHCWQYPPVKSAPVAAEPPVLLLPPAPVLHPFEASLEKMPAIEPIAAVQPAAAVEPPAKDVQIAPHLAIDLTSLTIRELKALARDRQLKRYCNFTKAELIAALSA